MGSQYEEGGLTFVRIERETPILRPALQLNQSSLCSFHRSRDHREGTNGQAVIVKKTADGRRLLMKREKGTRPKTNLCETP